MMTSAQIRQAFLDFFREKGHEIVPSAPMVIKNDPTLMFTNAGMNQFKDLFLGNSPIKHKRIADTQKCLRVSGKHNDLEEVGVDTYHHTMFEMLGNWSFGDYFKKEAIEWSWQLLTEVYKIPKDKLYVTVFEGSKDDKLAFDQEAYDTWKKFIAEDRIIHGNKKDNFWEMGDTGPCGPCSEIHVDIRTEEERKKQDGKSLVNMGHPQVIEIWNNVFMEFNRKADGSLEKLPAQHVDTGMGLERLCVALQEKTSNYDTDIFQPIIKELEKISGKSYGTTETKENEMTRISMRVCADHIRAISFSITDGQLLSNTGAGYVIRRILRRAVRYGYQGLDLKEPFLHRLIPALVKVMGDAFPELKNQQELVTKVIREEETAFYRTLENGLKRMEAVCAENKKSGIVPGKVVFELYDTYGFPDDLTSLIARDHGLSIDEKGFNEELNKQKERSRAATQLETGDWIEVNKGDATEFVGYDKLETETKILRYREVSAKGKKFFQLVLDKTPFYAEGGGQVGDKGILSSPKGNIEITDTKKENNIIVHEASALPADVKTSFTAKVNAPERKNTACNHSATHLLHEALRTVLGTHVEQKGSLVNDGYLRFDFSHFSKMTPEEITQVENKVNEKIREGLMLEENRSVDIEKAKAMGAMALFGEKYGDKVRVIKFGSSVELCGGIHVKNTAEIGSFKITSESAVAAGIRRIEAITGAAVLEHYKQTELLLEEVKQLVKNTKDPLKAIADLQTQNAELQKKLEAFNREKAGSLKKELVNAGEDVKGIKLITKQVDLDNASIKDLAFQLKAEMKNTVMLLASNVDGKPSLNVMVSDDLVSGKKMHAGNLVKELAKCINGGGGGAPFFATAGGTNADGIGKALTMIKELI